MAIAKRSFRASRKKIFRIAIFATTIGPYWEKAVQGIARHVREARNGSIAMASFDEVSEQDVTAGLVDGVIIDNWDNNQTLLAKCRAKRIPVVDVSGDGGRSGVGVISPNDRMVGQQVAEYFLSRGFRNFAFYGLPGAIETAWDTNRKTGFHDTVRTAGYDCAIFLSSTSTWDHLHQPVHLQSLEQWLTGLPRPVGILACIDKFAYEILKLARQNNIRVPDELALCGVAKREWIGTLANPTIRSIPGDGQKAGTKAAEMLMHMMKYGELTVPPQLIEPLAIVHRESTNTYAFPDEAVVEALKFIRDNAHKHISVEEIVDHLVISRRSLEMRFKKWTGVTLQNQIWFAHVELAKKLLLESAQPMHEICENSGFRSAAVFNVVFRRLAGTTPTNFRRRTRHASI